jgi:hypothetical protein
MMRDPVEDAQQVIEQTIFFQVPNNSFATLSRRSSTRAAATCTAGVLLLIVAGMVAVDWGGKSAQMAEESAISRSTPLTNDHHLSAELNERFLQAVVSGQEGQGVLSKLQEIWFVESNSKHTELSKEATHLASSLLTAGFPEDMRQALDVEANPCQDMYQFACGKYRFDHFPEDTDGVARVRMQRDMKAMLSKDQGSAGGHSHESAAHEYYNTKSLNSRIAGRRLLQVMHGRGASGGDRRHAAAQVDELL